MPAIIKKDQENEEHLYNPATIHKLQQATRLGDYQLFKEYSKMIDEEGAHLNLRGLMQFKKQNQFQLKKLNLWNQLLEDLKQVRCLMDQFQKKHMKQWRLQ